MTDYRSSIKSGIIWNAVASFARYGLQFAAVMILARLLTPDDYGLVGVLTVFITVADALVDSGLGGAVVKKANATDIDFSTLTVYNFFVSAIIYLLYYYSAPYVADYYNMPELTGLMRLYALTILVYALTVAPRAYLTKCLRFKAIALLNTFAGAIALVVAIILAYNDFGPYTIVWQYLINSIIFSVGTIFMAKYKFSLRFSWESFKEQFNFGFYT
ncbi:MAG: oligosaccharide flippase family protein, partial [Prevotellaceae bacterium]|nr:oligosaccharide flippase family protein [Candidatus Colivivens equi]